MSTSEREPLGGYQPRLVVRDGKYFFHVSELGLIASGDDVQSAYSDLVARYAELIAQARAADLFDDLPPAGPSGAAAGQVTVARGSLREFLTRSAIVLVAVLVLVLPVSWIIGGTVSRAVAELKGSMKIGHKLERELSRAAREDKAMDPERRERILAELRVVVSRAKPFVEAVRPLFSDPDCPAQSGACKR